MFRIGYKGFVIHGFRDIATCYASVNGRIVAFKSLHAAKLALSKILKEQPCNA